jgi:hypothetical protein
MLLVLFVLDENKIEDGSKILSMDGGLISRRRNDVTVSTFELSLTSSSPDNNENIIIMIMPTITCRRVTK